MGMRRAPTEALATISQARLVGIVRLDSSDAAVAAADIALSSGLGVVEVAYTLPDAGRAIQKLTTMHPESLIGAGTVRTRGELEDAVASGADFIVAPGLNADLVRAAAELNVLMAPGVFTATELDQALELGCSLVKLFPAEPAGPGYLRALLQPFPGAKLLATGGISPANAGGYLSAGAVAVAMGGTLFSNNGAAEGTIVAALAAVS